MSLKAINESYRSLSVRALRSKLVAHIKKYKRQMLATVLAWVASFRGNNSIGVGGFGWQ